MPRNLEKYSIWVLCEDKNQYHFIRKFLGTQGFNEIKIQPARNLPEGHGSGEQFVRTNFIDVVNQYIHKRKLNENVLLIIIQDTDIIREPMDIKNEFEKLLQKNKLNTTEVKNKLLFVFSKRNIETWFEWILQEPERIKVSETEDYKQKHKRTLPAKIGRKASELFTMSKNDNTICINAPSSLIYACEEFTNLRDRLMVN